MRNVLVDLNNMSSGNYTGTEILWRALQYSLRDLVSILPLILIALLIIAVYTLVAIILTRLIRSILRLINIDELAKPLIKYRISLTNIIIILLNLGIGLLAVYSIALIVYPAQVEIITSIVSYIARVASVVFLIIFVFIMLETIIERIRMEAKLRGFMFLIILFVTLALLLDITALSEEVKHALALGISIGIGLSIGVFSLWYFFHDLFEKKHSGGDKK
ncbi:MAG: hypothetical protein DRO16_03695 [Thermoprotei archaeon]|nr:MAG: hypothetical protein DRO16_03695 [Thermoprotei archaeon]